MFSDGPVRALWTRAAEAEETARVASPRQQGEGGARPGGQRPRAAGAPGGEPARRREEGGGAA